MEQRRSIQDIIPPARSRPLRERPEPSRETPPPPRYRPSREESSSEEPRRRMGLFVMAGVAVAAVAGVVLAQTVFHGASVSVIPNQRTVTVDALYTASKSGASNLAFQTMTLDETASQKVPATGEETVNERASGAVVVYNKGSREQRLITNTRFETPEGLIYRVQKSIVVPGATSGTPGSLEITVYADEPGAAHNIGLADFTLPGLEGTAQFQEIYARSKTPMTGGFTGTRKTVDAAARDAARQSLREQLQASLATRAAQEIPDGFILPENGVFMTYETLPDGSEGDDAIISVRGIAHAVILPLSSVAAEVARGTIGNYDGLPVSIADPSALSVDIAEPGDTPWESDSLSVRISGVPHVVWVVDELALKNALLGTSRRDLSGILSAFPAVERAEASLYPLWAGSFPDKAEKIKIRQAIGPEAGSGQ